jgi:hypothetical protein
MIVVGGVTTLPIADFRLSIGMIAKVIRQSAIYQIGNVLTHPLPRGGTDFMGPLLTLIKTASIPNRRNSWPKS